MPSLIHVGVPTAPQGPLAVSGAAGVGWLDRAQNSDAGTRVLGSLAASFSPTEHWLVGLELAGYRDRFGNEVNGYGEPRLAGRYVGELAPGHTWGAQLDLRFVGAEAPSLDLGATSPSLRGLYGNRLNERTWIAAQLGLHINNSTAVVPDVAAIAGNDKRSLAASTWNGLPWGAGASYRALDATYLIGELSGEWYVGKNAPGFATSPVRLSVGAQHWFGRELGLFAGADLALSKRKPLDAGQVLIEEPRLTGRLGLTWIFATEAPLAKAPPAVPKVVVAAPPPVEAPAPVAVPPQGPPVSPVTGILVDEGGRPMPDVEVVLSQEGQPTRTERTFADGHFEFANVPEGALALEVAEAGFERATVRLEADKPRASEIVLRPAVPAGQMRGKVLDLQGNPVSAKVTVTPDGQAEKVQSAARAASVNSDGSFELDLAPGRYVVRFEHNDFAAQRRSIVVKDKGVVILNIALIR